MLKSCKPILCRIPAILLLSAAAHSTETGNDFRISGIMQLGEHKFQALVEFANGQKKIVASGDSLADGKVLGISDNCLVLSLAGKTQQKCLAGVADNPAEAKAADVDPPQKRGNSAMPENFSPFKPVDKSRLRQALDGAGKAKNAAELGAAIMSLLNMPSGMRIVEIEGEPITSVQNAIETMRNAIDESRNIRLSLHSPGNPEHITIYLQTAPQITSAP